MSQPKRLAEGGLIDRSRPLSFRFNGRPYKGYEGDTLASALIANGVHLVGRSFKYHRPRGIMAAGVEDPNGLVQVGRGATTVPNLMATQVPLSEGLRASSVNVFPSARFDAGAALGWGSKLLPAGFYYKTFFGSPWLWRRVYEPMIRRAAGWGKAPNAADPDRYDHRHHHCDVLVVGAGPAGLAAARAAARSGARVVLADIDDRFGGSLLSAEVEIEGRSGSDWSDQVVDLLGDQDEVCLLPRTTVFGCYDGNYLCALERITDGPVRERLWHIRAREVVLATGAHERPLVFANNDRPGIMLAGAVTTYLRRWAAKPGERMVLFTNNDRAYESAVAANEAGIEVAAVVDSRTAVDPALSKLLSSRNIRHLTGHVVTRAEGTKRVTAAQIGRLSGDRIEGKTEKVDCDLLAVSGGLSPAVHLFSQAQGKLAYDETLACLRPAQGAEGVRSAGACNGTFDLAGAMAEGARAGAAAAQATGFEASVEVLTVSAPWQHGAIEPLWSVPTASKKGKRFVDLQNDTSVADIELAVREGFDSAEHLKRYTLTGFGTDQGRTSNVNALGILAGAVGRPIGEVGTTTFRPPYTPVTFGTMGGRHRGDQFDPARLTPMHDWHTAQGAVFEDVGQWKRPRYFPKQGEDMKAAVARECKATRESVGIFDASTLGKIDIQGPDAAEFLNRVYTNGWKTLPVGKARYGIMCGEDGMVFDDGTTARLSEQHYFITTTTGGAAGVLDHLEEFLQTEWPDLRVRLTSVTEQWANVSLAGPRSRDVLAAMAPDLDLSPEGFGFLQWRDAKVAGLDARVFRVSFTGELQYEINVPWHFGQALWDAAMAAGEPFGITPYGTETMHVLRAEKGFIIVGQETDGTTTPDDLGLGRMVSTKKDFIGKRSLSRADCLRPDRKQLVGLLPENAAQEIAEGSQLVEVDHSKRPPPIPMIGFVTSSYWSATLETNFCLALVERGRSRHGDVVEVALKDGPALARIVDPVFYDKEGTRRDGN
ncbi:MAG: sarcosine oxidase subunit alpha family protein [Pseudomonadota bacterium]